MYRDLAFIALSRGCIEKNKIVIAPITQALVTHDSFFFPTALNDRIQSTPREKEVHLHRG